MIKLKWIGLIPRQWLEIATQSLEAWKLRDEKPLFLPEFPLHGLGPYDDYESWNKYKGYVWSGWTTRKAQPMHIDPALQALIDQSAQGAPNAASQTYVSLRTSLCGADW